MLSMVKAMTAFLISHLVNYDNNVEVWHARLGHIGQSRMNRLTKEGLLGNLNKVELSTYKHHLLGKTEENHLENELEQNFLCY